MSTTARPLPESKQHTSAPHDCDGSTHNGSRNCRMPAVWQVKQKDMPTWVWGACGQHLHQVATTLLDGERGELDIRRIATVE